MLELTDILTFGKYKGLTIERVIEKDSKYIAWLRSERQKKNRENLLTPAADTHLTRVERGLPPRLSEAEMKDEAGAEVLRKAFATKAENEAREADAKRTREEIYGKDWGGW